MKLKLKATVQRKASDHDSISDAIGVWMDNNLVEGFPEGAELDSWMAETSYLTSLDTNNPTGEVQGSMAVMLPDGSGLDGQFVAYFVGDVCTKVVFSAPAYDED